MRRLEFLEVWLTALLRLEGEAVGRVPWGQDAEELWRSWGEAGSPLPLEALQRWGPQAGPLFPWAKASTPSKERAQGAKPEPRGPLLAGLE